MVDGYYIDQSEEDPIPTLLTPSLASFPLFPLLPPEIRDHIWALSLPSPRVLKARGSNTIYGPDTKYQVSGCSIGGAHPTILSVNQESRAEALKHLTCRFRGYWNLKLDFLYIAVEKWCQSQAWMQLADIVERGLLEGFRNLALPLNILQEFNDHTWMESPRKLHNITTCAFILDNRNWHSDILARNQSWSLSRKRDGRGRAGCAATEIHNWLTRERLDLNCRKEWKERPSEMQFTICVIEGRNMVKRSKWKYPESPKWDPFG